MSHRPRWCCRIGTETSLNEVSASTAREDCKLDDTDPAPKLDPTDGLYPVWEMQCCLENVCHHSNSTRFGIRAPALLLGHERASSIDTVQLLT